MDCAQRAAPASLSRPSTIRWSARLPVRWRGAGIPMVTLCSDIGEVDRLAYIGIDNRAAGRTSGFLLADRLRAEPSFSDLGGREREVTVLFADLAGFTRFCEGRSPGEIIEMVNGNDDPGLNFAGVSELIAKHPDLLGVYCVGGGQGAVAAAIETAGLAQRLVMIGHNFNDENKPFLLSGTIDAVIHQDAARIAEAALNCRSA